jgi:GNAT superfamily N-acetyltransferase
MAVTIVPATAERWDDLVELFGTRGDPSRCWCLYFRFGADYRRATPEHNREVFGAIVKAGREPGLLAYDGGAAVGWVSIAPRREFETYLERSRLFKPVPGEGVWSVLCFVVKVDHRRRGVATALLEAAVDYARERGAAAVEGHPVEVSGRTGGANLYTGTTTMFADAGFTEIDRRGGRPVYRLTF